MCILKVLVIAGYLVSVGSEQADKKYVVKYEDIQVVRLREFCR